MACIEIFVKLPGMKSIQILDVKKFPAFFSFMHVTVKKNYQYSTIKQVRLCLNPQKNLVGWN